MRICKISGSDLSILPIPSLPLPRQSSFMSDSPPATPEQQNGIVAEDNTLEGLADAWESDPRVRRRTVKLGGSLIQWPNKKQIGVVNFPALKANIDVLFHLMEYWGPVAPDRKTPHADFIKPQVGRTDETTVVNWMYSERLAWVILLCIIMHKLSDFWIHSIGWSLISTWFLLRIGLHHLPTSVFG